MQLIPGRRPQNPTPSGALRGLVRIPDHFVDDGCSNSPDRWFGFDLSWACRLHDAAYCSRLKLLGPMDQRNRKRADDFLKKDIRAVLPWRWRWVGWIYWAGVRAGGGFKSYNTCFANDPVGASPEQAKDRLCRHGIKRTVEMCPP